MPLVPWAPPQGDPKIWAVLAPLGEELRKTDYLELLAQRVHQLIRHAGREQAEESIQTFLPLDHDFLGLNPNFWAANILEAGEWVQARLAEQVGYPWPLRVAGYQPQAAQALQEVDLPTWLNLAVPRERDDQPH